MASIYGEELTGKPQEDVSFNGVSLRSVDPSIMSVRLIEDAPEMDVQYGQRAALDGRFVLSARRIRKTLAVEFNLRGRFDLAARGQVLDKINAWAVSAHPSFYKEAGTLTASVQHYTETQANPPAILRKRIVCRCSRFATPGDAWSTTQMYRLEFETLGIPYWMEQDYTRTSTSSLQHTIELVSRGNVPWPPIVTVTPANNSDTMDSVAVSVHNNIDNSDYLMAFEGAAWSRLTIGLNYMTGLNEVLALHEDFNSWPYLTADSDDRLLVVPGATSLLRVETDVSSNVAYTLRGWYL